MSGYISSDFRHNCERDGCLQDRAPSFEWMRDCFPRGIMPSDLDGVVEINGHVLFIEAKGCGGSLIAGSGQARLLRVLSRFPNATVWLIRETEDAGIFECLYRNGETEPSGWERYTVTEMQTWLREWAAHADRLGGVA